jgi:hypothetical protein
MSSYPVPLSVSRYLSKIGKVGGSSTSERKVEAARKNVTKTQTVRVHAERVMQEMLQELSTQ